MFSDIKIILFIIFVNVVFGKLIVEDTLIIHPITWETSSPQGWNAQYEKIIKFPDKDTQWRKIFLIQTLKCDSTTQGDQYPCGEWDYSCHTYIHDSTRIDSIRYKTQSHTIVNYTGMSYNYSTTPVYNYFYIMLFFYSFFKFFIHW